ncbi:MAG: 30S ribosomal protein S9 [Mycobacteriales bacterium]
MPVAAPTAATPRSFVGIDPVQTVGRRKTAIVRVKLSPGTGQFQLDKKGKRVFTETFDQVQRQLIMQPFQLTGTANSFDVRATMSGGGTSGQAGAMVLAIARALIKIDADWRDVLKKAGLLTRDARAKERKKAGLKKARKAPQYSKR